MKRELTKTTDETHTYTQTQNKNRIQNIKTIKDELKQKKHELTQNETRIEWN